MHVLHVSLLPLRTARHQQCLLLALPPTTLDRILRVSTSEVWFRGGRSTVPTSDQDIHFINPRTGLYCQDLEERADS
jgi:hypothetical protein